MWSWGNYPAEWADCHPLDQDLLTLIDMTPGTGGENEVPISAIVTTDGNPHMWLRGPLQAIAGLLVDEVPPVLPPE
jgi:hypothetical protein